MRRENNQRRKYFNQELRKVKNKTAFPATAVGALTEFGVDMWEGNLCLSLLNGLDLPTDSTNSCSVFS